MCGIAGFTQRVDSSLVFKLLHHRGPDDRGVLKDEQISLYHTRLSIQDVKHGTQPFTFQNYTIIFNGEIYNHLALREELREFEFKTQSDTETPLYLFIKFGQGMFDKIDGMFAFCVYDKLKKTLFLARDRAGKKPLFYYQKGFDFAFASELNALSFLDVSIDEDKIKEYLTLGMCDSPYS